MWCAKARRRSYAGVHESGRGASQGLAATFPRVTSCEPEPADGTEASHGAT